MEGRCKMNWETCKTHLQATGLLYSPGNMRLKDDPCPLPESAALKTLMADISDVLTGGSIKIPITRLAELRFHCGYFELVHLFLCKLYNHLFKRDSIKMKTRIVQKWSLKKYKEIFSIEERSKLEDHEPNTWDIALLYKAIQVECWRMNGHEWMIMDQLVNLLKTQLHQLAHKKLFIDKAEIVLRTTYLSKILNKICMEGSKIHRVQHRDMKNLAEWIDPTITSLTLLLDKKNLSQEDFDQIPDLENRLAEYKIHLEFGLKYKMKLELFTCQLLYFSPSKLFSKIIVHEKKTGSDCIIQEIDYNNIFKIRLKDGSTPDMYIISGPRAVGKSIYLRYISQQSYEDPMSIPGVDQFELIFTSQFRNENMCNLKDLIRQKLPNTLKEMDLEVSEIENIILKGNILIMIDGYDEVSEVTQKFLQGLMSYGSNIKIICTTRSEDMEELVQIIPPSRNYVHITPKAHSLKENCMKIESRDMNTVREVMISEKTNNEWSSADTEPNFNDVSTQALKLCSFVERLLGASIIISKSKGKVDENTMIIFRDLLIELKEFRNEVEEFLQLSNEESEQSSKSEHSIFEVLVKREGYKDVCPQNKIEEMEAAELLIENLLENPDNVIKTYKDEKYFEIKSEFKEKEPHRQMIFASMEELANLGSRATDYSYMIDHNNSYIGNDTRKALWELVERIQDLRDQCDNYNYSLPAKITKKLPFTGLQYWFRKITSPYLRQDISQYCNEMVRVIDVGDNKLKRYLLTPEKTIQGPTLAEPWKDEADVEDNDKKTNWKPKTKSKSKKKKH